MSQTTKDAWADRYDRAAGNLLGEPVVAAAQFLRPRGWRQFGRAVACGPASVLARTTGRERRVRLPEAYLVAVTNDALHVLQARTEVGSGPVPRAIRELTAWERRSLAVDVVPDGLGTRLTVVPDGGTPVELVGPPGELTDRVVRALQGLPVEQPLAEASVAQAAPALAPVQPPLAQPVPTQPALAQPVPAQPGLAQAAPVDPHARERAQPAA